VEVYEAFKSWAQLYPAFWPTLGPSTVPGTPAPVPRDSVVTVRGTPTLLFSPSTLAQHRSGAKGLGTAVGSKAASPSRARTSPKAKWSLAWGSKGRSGRSGPGSNERSSLLGPGRNGNAGGRDGGGDLRAGVGGGGVGAGVALDPRDVVVHIGSPRASDGPRSSPRSAASTGSARGEKPSLRRALFGCVVTDV
jgi:hypothetical protein